eukprot:2344991-Alexandrium_andersonii.AAC.1
MPQRQGVAQQDCPCWVQGRRPASCQEQHRATHAPRAPAGGFHTSCAEPVGIANSGSGRFRPMEGPGQ